METVKNNLGKIETAAGFFLAGGGYFKVPLYWRCDCQVVGAKAGLKVFRRIRLRPKAKRPIAFYSLH